ncbi:glycosyltransferase family 39 protein [Basidiobolus meristosporus CBS 931.73]|uniref:Dolichyl-phosphate-mannose--protein mannosyltransferase n=1 Tax=Basidiobolus meristosporus CBS 931.73 TaxID=1314790 RepID=A0A1Y1XRW1_9FUNG|nr:glycosyltransferase family 39 protein [Basidiobolus meristosporus CBS 931.73]|eukprot:ORX88490.1 glycosyltransferase family 39 protein [Basidiobolus meristosporus CBS 931.73]
MEFDKPKSRYAPTRNLPVDSYSDYEEEPKIHKPPQLYNSSTQGKWYHNTNLVNTVILTLLSLFTRLFMISWSNVVVWDEAHFGKFGSYYLKRQFYHDVHPPLGKMLVALGGLISGYDGSFEFKSGEVYPGNLHYGVMRSFTALFGVVMVPLAYLTAIEFKFSKKAAFLSALMVLLDIAYLAISRFILLDSMLLCFTCTTLYCLACFHNCRKESFSARWWFWLFLTGVSIGCVSSVKWVGFFATALVGLYTIEDLWDKFGEYRMPKIVYLKHWAARIACLIILPILIYMFCFVIHFAILNHSGTGDANMSSIFQAGLVGSTLNEAPLEVAYGSRITLKNNGYGGGLLHSHVQIFPEGSQQQQVTAYHHRDENNEWIVKPTREAPLSEEIEFLKNGDVIRLVHASTQKNLHSHQIKAPMTKADWEVSCYGNETVGDSNDYWKVEIVDDYYEKNVPHVRTLTTHIRLRHLPTGCLLKSHNVPLPAWGFKQAEVTCDHTTDANHPNLLWNVENHWNENLTLAPPVHFKSKFLKDFWHLNVAMWNTNNALVPDPDKYDHLASEPHQWPILSVALRMCSWADDAVKFFLVGHPIVWWSSTLSLLAFATIVFVSHIRVTRGYNDWRPGEWDHFFSVGKIIFLGWFLHYIPFYIMGRVMYIHHYFPALYFAILMAGLVMDYATRRQPSEVQNLVFGGAYFIIIAVFLYFAPFAFGFTGPAKDMSGRQWVSGWKLYD